MEKRAIINSEFQRKYSIICATLRTAQKTRVKEVKKDMSIAERIMEELNCETVFSIGGIDILESTVVTWIIMAVLLLGSFLLTRNLKVQNISKRQAAVEFCVTKLEDIVTDMVGGERPQLCALSHHGAAVHRLCQPHRHFRLQAADEGFERHHRPGGHEHCPGAGGLHPGQRRQRLAAQLH